MNSAANKTAPTCTLTRLDSLNRPVLWAGCIRWTADRRGYVAPYGWPNVACDGSTAEIYDDKAFQARMAAERAAFLAS